MAESSPWIIDTTAARFEEDVVQQSMQRPVVVDLWAPWCGPCRQLGPVLERLAQEHRGKFVLVKVNIDEEPEIAQAFGVQSIPFVVAIKEGRPVDQFLGVLPERELRAWLEPLLPSPAEDLVREAEELEGRDLIAAEEKYREALALAPKNDNLRIRLARVLLAQDRDEECRALLAELEARGYLEDEAERIKSQLDLRAAAEEAGGVEQARRAVAAEPDNLALQLALADALAVAGKHREALELCLKVVQRDRAGMGNPAREAMLRIFDLLGSDSPLVPEYRRKLATALY